MCTYPRTHTHTHTHTEFGGDNELKVRSLPWASVLRPSLSFSRSSEQNLSLLNRSALDSLEDFRSVQASGPTDRYQGLSFVPPLTCTHNTRSHSHSHTETLTHTLSHTHTHTHKHTHSHTHTHTRTRANTHTHTHTHTVTQEHCLSAFLCEGKVQWKKDSQAFRQVPVGPLSPSPLWSPGSDTTQPTSVATLDSGCIQSLENPP